MKIRGKLSISFSLLVVMAILTFALISYYSIKEHIEKGRDEVFQQKVEWVSEMVRDLIRASVVEIKGTLFKNEEYQYRIENYDKWQVKDRSLIRNYFLDTMNENPYLSSITILGTDGDVVLSEGIYAGPVASKIRRIAGLDKNMSCPCEPQVYSKDTYMYIFYPFASNDKGSVLGLLVYQLGIEDIARALPVDSDIENLLFLISDGVSPIFMSGHTSQEILNALGLVRAPAMATLRKDNITVDPVIKLDGLYAFTSNVSSVDWNFTYIIPEKVYHEGLIDLRERIIIAVAVIIMLAIDIIFIIAYKISKPLTALSKASKDMIVYEYDTPLSFVHKNDEISELAGNFEAMRQKVKVLTTTDALTGVLNRKYFMVSLDKDFSRIKRAGGNLCCLMIDIDNFKSINDTMGHQCGDEALRCLGALMVDVSRKYDILGRYGGEEFIIALPDSSIESAERFAERLRSATQHLSIVCDAGEIKITISIGISHLLDDGQDNVELLIKRADEALYEAKGTGKNKVVVHRAADFEKT